MGVACRVFFVDDNDSLQQIPMTRLDRLLHFDRRESLQQYAGKRVRCAIVILEVVGRQVQAIRNIKGFVNIVFIGILRRYPLFVPSTMIRRFTKSTLDDFKFKISDRSILV
jgi:hypothetical protein